jgi:peptidoglycan/xylan/chitin deacetylase (PgdA/CDA1 family)
MTCSTRRLIKEGISLAVDGSGFLRRMHRGRVLIVLYHRILPDRALEQVCFSRSTFVSCSSFEQNLEYFRREYHPISMAEYLDRLQSGSWDVRRKYLLVTFDDGWADNYHHAWPILKKFDMPATIFLATGLVGEPRAFWWNELGEILCQLVSDSEKMATAKDVIASFLGSSGVASIDWTSSIDAWIERVKQLPFPRIREMIDALSASVPCPSTRSSALTWAQIEEMSGQGLVRFGPHSVHHALLTRLTAEESAREIGDSLNELRARAKVNWDPVFSYPGGAYNPQTVEQVRQAGCGAALTVDPGINPLAPAELFRLRRINIDGQSASSLGLLKFRLAKATVEGFSKT